MEKKDDNIQEIKVKRVKKGPIPKYAKEIPHLTTEQMIEVDRLMIEKYKIELIQMMENAGRNLALLAKNSFLKKKKFKQNIAVLAGTGGNGGGALVCARRLTSWGYPVVVDLTDETQMTPIPGHQLEILKNMGVPVRTVDQLADQGDVGLIIDGVIGYSLHGDPFGAAKTMIEWANKQEAPVLSLDTPSGIDLTEGTIYNPAVRADATLTLALPKVGLFSDEVKPLRGKLYLGDISVPPALYAQPSLGLVVKSIFRQGDVLRID